MKKASRECLDLIKKYEGLRLAAYKCPAGVYTIGYGHTSGVKAGMKITTAQAEDYLLSDISRFEKHVNEINDTYKYNFNQHQFDALVSFAFNIGNIKQLTANGTRNKKTIGEKMLLYNKSGGKVLEGLKKRRQEEHDLYTREDFVKME